MQSNEIVSVLNRPIGDCEIELIRWREMMMMMAKDAELQVIRNAIIFLFF